jgi:hypothetical protein
LLWQERNQSSNERGNAISAENRLASNIPKIVCKGLMDQQEGTPLRVLHELAIGFYALELRGTIGIAFIFIFHLF